MWHHFTQLNLCKSIYNFLYYDVVWIDCKLWDCCTFRIFSIWLLIFDRLIETHKQMCKDTMQLNSMQCNATQICYVTKQMQSKFLSECAKIEKSYTSKYKTIEINHTGCGGRSTVDPVRERRHRVRRREGWLGCDFYFDVPRNA